MKKTIILAVLIAFCLGCAAAWGVLTVQAGKALALQEEDEETMPRPKAMIAEAGQDDTIATLRARIQELEAQQAFMGDAEVAESVVVAETAPQQRRNGFEGMRERMEQMKRDDPERYARMEQRRQQFLQRRAHEVQSKLDFFASIDTTGMSRKARENHEALQNLIAQREELMAAVGQEDLSEEERHEQFMTLRETDREIWERNEMERETLLYSMAEVLSGGSAADANEIVDTITEIYEATSNAGGFGGREGPPPGPPPEAPMGGR